MSKLQGHVTVLKLVLIMALCMTGCASWALPVPASQDPLTISSATGHHCLSGNKEDLAQLIGSLEKDLSATTRLAIKGEEASLLRLDELQASVRRLHGEYQGCPQDGDSAFIQRTRDARALLIRMDKQIQFIAQRRQALMNLHAAIAETQAQMPRLQQLGSRLRVLQAKQHSAVDDAAAKTVQDLCDLILEYVKQLDVQDEISADSIFHIGKYTTSYRDLVDAVDLGGDPHHLGFKVHAAKGEAHRLVTEIKGLYAPIFNRWNNLLGRDSGQLADLVASRDAAKDVKLEAPRLVDDLWKTCGCRKSKASESF